MSIRLYSVLLSGLLLAACSSDKLGAVSFRWRLVDKSSGTLTTARDYAQPDGSCLCTKGQRDCPTSCGWRVTKVRLHASSLVGGVPMPIDLAEQDVEFPCSVGEATTAFRIPAGTLALSIDGYDPAPPHMIQATGPAPQVRTIVPAQVVNLDIVELAVAHGMIYAADAGPVASVLDGGCE